MNIGQLKEGFNVLDKGYVKLVDYMGEESAIIEAARMSTGKGFVSWDEYKQCKHCLLTMLPGGAIPSWCDKNNGEHVLETKKDSDLLEYLYANQHMTPFEMVEVKFEIKAPLVVFREWHRHRTQSYNEFSARYAVMPNEHYVPEPGRIAKQSKSNKQGSGDTFSLEDAIEICSDLSNEQEAVYQNYDRLIGMGVANEIARLNTPVSRYSKMTAKTDLRNWLSFLSLRMELSAQKEIRQFANAVAVSIKTLYPRTFKLWQEHSFFATRFSATEMRHLRAAWRELQRGGYLDDMGQEGSGMTKKQFKAFESKLETDKEAKYADVVAFMEEPK
jgi:thymidylate synthase (FAD)